MTPVASTATALGSYNNSWRWASPWAPWASVLGTEVVSLLRAQRLSPSPWPPRHTYLSAHSQGRGEGQTAISVF